METEKYYDENGVRHTVACEWSFGSIVIYVDGIYYTRADNRIERQDTIKELVAANKWSTTKPRKKTATLAKAR